MILTACCCILFHLYSCNYSPVLGPYLRRAISKYDVDVIIGTKIKNVLNLLKSLFSSVNHKRVHHMLILHCVLILSILLH